MKWLASPLSLKVQAEIEPKEEAWVLPEKGRTTINSVTMLAAIGEFQLTFDLVNLISGCYAICISSAVFFLNNNFPLREEVDADDCAVCLHRLHRSCFNFLFWCDLKFKEVECLFLFLCADALVLSLDIKRTRSDHHFTFLSLCLKVCICFAKPS